MHKCQRQVNKDKDNFLMSKAKIIVIIIEWVPFNG